jgi:putative hydrolase
VDDRYVGTVAHEQIPDTDFNSRMAAMFRRAANLLEAQDADTYRVLAYRNGADELESLTESVVQIYRRDGLWGLIALPTIGRSLALAIADVVDDGHWRWLDRLEGDTDPEKVLATLPTIGPRLARRIHLELGVESLEDLERAVYDGRLGRLRGIGDKRWHAIRDSVVVRLHSRRGRHHDPPREAPFLPSAELLLSIDEEYRTKADRNELVTIAPQRFNPTGSRWLPVLHTTREGHHFTAMFSNTARAHELGRTNDWVVIFADTPDEDRWTVVTETHGPHVGERVVRGHLLRTTAADPTSSR